MPMRTLLRPASARRAASPLWSRPSREPIRDALCVRGPEHFLRRHIHEVRVLVANVIETRLDVLHLVQIFHRSLFAGGDDQPLLADHQRNLGDPLDGHKILYRLGADIDEGAQAVVLAEIAARGFVARGAVFDLADRVHSDERSLQAVSPQAQRFLRGADGA